MSIFSALLTRISNNGKTFQGSFLGKTKSGIRNLTPYGFFSIPPVDSKLVMFKDAFESNYAIGYKDDIIPILKEGEAVFGNFVKASQIKFNIEGKIQIKNSSTDLLTLLTELKTILKTATLIDNVTLVYGTTTQTAIDVWFINLQKLLTTE